LFVLYYGFFPEYHCIMTNRDAFDARGTLKMLERKFIQEVLTEEGAAIEADQTRAIRSWNLIRTEVLLKQRHFRVDGARGGDRLGIFFVPYLRFLDMKNPRRKNHPKGYELYNRILFGHLRQIRRTLMYGFTSDVKTLLARKYQIEL
jgi:hypothetical protein